MVTKKVTQMWCVSHLHAANYVESIPSWILHDLELKTAQMDKEIFRNDCRQFVFSSFARSASS